MKRMFKTFSLGNLELVNRFIFPPIKIGRGNPDGTVTDRPIFPVFSGFPAMRCPPSLASAKRIFYLY